MTSDINIGDLVKLARFSRCPIDFTVEEKELREKYSVGLVLKKIEGIPNPDWINKRTRKDRNKYYETLTQYLILWSKSGQKVNHYENMGPKAYGPVLEKVL